MERRKYVDKVTKAVSVGYGGDEVIEKFGQRKYGATWAIRQDNYIKGLSNEDLYNQSREKAPNGCFTQLAMQAQKEIYKRKTYQGIDVVAMFASKEVR